MAADTIDNPILDGPDVTSMSELPNWMVNRPTASFYQFGTLLGAASGVLSDEFVPLVPNGARRLVEAFIAHRAPNDSGNHNEAMEQPSKPTDNELEDVYRFRNGYSDDEIVGITQLPSLATTVDQMLRTFHLIKTVDEPHFRCMCGELGVDGPLTTNVKAGS